MANRMSNLTVTPSTIYADSVTKNVTSDGHDDL